MCGYHVADAAGRFESPIICDPPPPQHKLDGSLISSELIHASAAARRLAAAALLAVSAAVATEIEPGCLAPVLQDPRIRFRRSLGVTRSSVSGSMSCGYRHCASPPPASMNDWLAEQIGLRERRLNTGEAALITRPAYSPTVPSARCATGKTAHPQVWLISSAVSEWSTQSGQELAGILGAAREWVHGGVSNAASHLMPSAGRPNKRRGSTVVLGPWDVGACVVTYERLPGLPVKRLHVVARAEPITEEAVRGFIRAIEAVLATGDRFTILWDVRETGLGSVVAARAHLNTGLQWLGPKGSPRSDMLDARIVAHALLLSSGIQRTFVRFVTALTKPPMPLYIGGAADGAAALDFARTHSLRAASETPSNKRRRWRKSA